MQKALKKEYLDSLVVLRGIAVVFVCFGHLVKALRPEHYSNFFADFFYTYGQFGIYIFFVISGFVIPLSFNNGNYNIKNYFTFLYKRFLRLHPPFCVAVVFTLLITAVSCKIRHLVFPETALSIIKTFFYLHLPADNPVFWTLGIEAQYYLFIGLFYVVIINYPKIAVGIFIPVLIATNSIPVFHDNLTLLSFLLFFMIGTTAFVIYKNVGSMIINCSVAAALFIYAFITYEHAAVVLSLGTFLAILFFKGRIARPLLFPGTISYSLYLIHFPLGVKIINLLSGRINHNYYSVLFLFDFILIVGLSWVFYKLIEVPCENLSRKIRYKASGEPQ